MRILFLSQSNYVDRFYSFGILDRASGAIDFAGFLRPETLENVRRCWILFRDAGQVSLIFWDYLSENFGILENAAYEKIQVNIVEV